MKSVLILGSTGLLGSTLSRELSAFESWQTVRTSRNGDIGVKFNPLDDEFETLFQSINPDYIINCLGTVKQRILSSDVNQYSVLKVNTILPHEIVSVCEKYGSKLIQIGTDCVYSGETGKYDEYSAHDAQDLYGKSKSLGEPTSPNFMMLRSSFVGPEVVNKLSFYEWVNNYPLDTPIYGYTNHLWNGVAATTIAKVLSGILRKDGFVSGNHHLVPADVVTKLELMKLVISITGRCDLTPIPRASELSVDRTLATHNSDFNEFLWSLAGWQRLPTVQETLEQIDISQIS